MVLTKKQKKELVIKLSEEGKTTKEIAKTAKMSLRDIGPILREYNHEPEPKPPKTDHSKAFRLFSKNKTPIEVSIKVDLSFETVKTWYSEYLFLKNMSCFVNIFENYTNFLPFFIEIAGKMKIVNYFRRILTFC